MVFSKTLEYALQTVIFLSKYPANIPVSQKEITSSLDIPHHYLGKIIQRLTHSGIIGSKTGPTGGFFLAKPSVDITLCDILYIFEGDNFFDGCVLGFPGCDDETPCLVHEDWKVAKDIIKKFMQNNTIADWSENIEIKLNHIKQLKIQKSMKNKR